MRPLYENENTKEAESKVIEQFADFLHLDANKLSFRHEIDFALCDDDENIVAFAEVKCRNISMHAFDTFFISAMKYKEALNFLNVFKKPIYFIVKWKDFIGYWEVKELENPDIKWSGNKKRNDGQGDIEPVLHIPVSEFVIFK
jgi:hypothetical protein